MPQHVFAVVACRLALGHPGQAGRVQPAQQHGTLHLRRGDRQHIVQRQRVPRALNGHRQPPALTGGEACAAGRQRLGHAPHRPLAQTGIAGHHRKERMAGQNPGQQPRGGAGIAHVEHIRRLHQPADAAPGDAPLRVRHAHHLRTQRAHGGGGAQHILALQQPRDAGLAHRQRAEHQRAVRDGLVAGHAQRAGQRGGRPARGQRLDGRMGHAAALSMDFCACQSSRKPPCAKQCLTDAQSGGMGRALRPPTSGDPQRGSPYGQARTRHQAGVRLLRRALL